MKPIRLILTFYKGFAASGIFITFLCFIVYSAWKASAYMIVPLFWFKAISDVIIFYYIKNAKRKEFYYYRALGVSASILWIGSFSIDFFLYIVTMILTGKFCHA